MTIEVVIRQGLPSVEVTGNLGKNSLEGVKRLETSLRATGYSWPKGKVYICVSPTQQPKEGNSLDLALAVAILAADRQIVIPKEVIVLGEVSLTGVVREFQHRELILRRVRHSNQVCLLPEATTESRGTTDDIHVSIRTIRQLRDVTLTTHSRKIRTLRPIQKEVFLLDQVYGQKAAKRVLSISLAGKIPLLITGPSGVGKTLLVRSAGQLLPDLSEYEHMSMLNAYTRAGLASTISTVRSVVTPNLESNPRELFRKLGLQPGGYASLAAWGVLFLDELPERGKEVVDTLRQVLETPDSNSDYSVTVIAAQNTCFCGRFGGSGGMCTCSPGDLAKYHRTFSEAIYQRFPLSIYMPQPKDSDCGESGKRIAEAINRVWSRRELYRFTGEAERYFTRIVATEKLSPRTQANLRRVSQVIATLDERDSVDVASLEEALAYRYRPATL